MDGIESMTPDVPNVSRIMSWRNIPPRYLTENEIMDMFGSDSHRLPVDVWKMLRENIDYENIWKLLNGSGDDKAPLDPRVSSHLKSDILWKKLFRKDYGHPFRSIEFAPLRDDIREKARSREKHAVHHGHSHAVDRDSWYILYMYRKAYEHNLVSGTIPMDKSVGMYANEYVHDAYASFTIWEDDDYTHVVEITSRFLMRW